MNARNTINKAFTLIEILVATTLTLIIVGAATTSFTQLLTLTRRVQVIQSMDSSAKSIYDKLNNDISNMHPCTAVWLNSDSTLRSVELIFMKSLTNPKKFSLSAYPPFQFTDLVWSRWKWTSNTQILETSESRSARWFHLDNTTARTPQYWPIPGGSKMTHDNFYGPSWSHFISIPQPTRETGTISSPNSPVALLDHNSWNTGEASDIGDYTDLLHTARPLVYQCTELTIEFVNLDGSTKTANESTNLAWSTNGHYINGEPYATMSSRPGIIRIRFTLSNTEPEAQSTFSFSFATPHTHRE